MLKQCKQMCKPFKNTPTLYGKDARKFNEAFDDPNKKDRISDETRKRMKASYEKLKSWETKNE